jgi:hypothetical protein
MLIFAEGGKTLEAWERINSKINSHVIPCPGIEPEITVVSEHSGVFRTRK